MKRVLFCPQVLANTRPGLRETYKELKASLVRDRTIVSDGADLVSAVVSYRQNTRISNPLVQCLLSTIKNKKKKRAKSPGGNFTVFQHNRIAFVKCPYSM